MTAYNDMGLSWFALVVACKPCLLSRGTYALKYKSLIIKGTHKYAPTLYISITAIFRFGSTPMQRHSIRLGAAKMQDIFRSR